MISSVENGKEFWCGPNELNILEPFKYVIYDEEKFTDYRCSHYSLWLPNKR